LIDMLEIGMYPLTLKR